MLEEVIERHLTAEIERAGGRCEKIVNLTRRGWPDRTVMLPGLGVDLVELKKPGEAPEAHQTRVHEYLATCGQPVYLLDSIEKVDEYVHTRVVLRLHDHRLWSIWNVRLT